MRDARSDRVIVSFRTTNEPAGGDLFMGRLLNIQVKLFPAERTDDVLD
jgi:hypothetical protein